MHSLHFDKLQYFAGSKNFSVKWARSFLHCPKAVPYFLLDGES